MKWDAAKEGVSRIVVPAENVWLPEIAMLNRLVERERGERERDRHRQRQISIIIQYNLLITALIKATT